MYCTGLDREMWSGGLPKIYSGQRVQFKVTNIGVGRFICLTTIGD